MHLPLTVSAVTAAEGPSEIGIGKTLQVITTADDQHIMTLGLALKEATIPLGTLGTLRLDPGAMVLASMVSANRVPQPWSLPVPNDVNLVGLTARFQGLDIPPAGTARFTRLLRVPVVR